MFKKVIFALGAMAIFSAVPAMAGPATGCNKISFYGSFTRPADDPDVFGDGTNVHHASVFQLEIHNDGTAAQHWTGLLDYPINTGSGSGWRGSWTCRADGKLVVTFLLAGYLPVVPGGQAPVTTPDVELVFHARTTYLFSVDNANQLTRIQARSRTYAPDEDPTNPTGGNLGALSTSPLVFTRLTASDSDLNLP